MSKFTNQIELGRSKKRRGSLAGRFRAKLWAWTSPHGVAKSDVDPSLCDLAESLRFIFICGMHRSGTTILASSLREHGNISVMSGTGQPMDEGQHCQCVYPSDDICGGMMRFGYHPKMRMCQIPESQVPRIRTSLLRSWLPYWDLSKQILVEKSPPNLIKTRFLTQIFPKSKYLLIARDPLINAIAVRSTGWGNVNYPISCAINHWALCHSYFLSDACGSKQYLSITLHELRTDTVSTANKIAKFVGVDKLSFPSIQQGNDSKYDMELESLRRDRRRWKWEMRKRITPEIGKVCEQLRIDIGRERFG